MPLRWNVGRTARELVRRLLRSATGSRWLTPVVLVALVVAISAAAAHWGPRVVPPSSLTLPLIAAGLFLQWRLCVVVCVLAAVGMGVDVAILGVDDVRIGSVVQVIVVGVFALVLASARDQVGAPGLRGEAMVLELRSRLTAQGHVRRLPKGWSVESAVATAGSGVFGGDFIVSLVRNDRLELALIDVSGKGVDAGTRALLLSGAFGGLLGAVEPGEFLHKANDYLLRQDWEEGFATAVHLTVDLRSGDYTVETAGHPPVIHYDAGSGGWHVSAATGVALGLLPEPSYSSEAGTLRRGDALLLYTDGLVEEPGRDLSVGIDRLMGAAETLVKRGFVGAPRALLGRVAQDANDDRALVFVWRTG